MAEINGCHILYLLNPLWLGYKIWQPQCVSPKKIKWGGGGGGGQNIAPNSDSIANNKGVNKSHD